MTAEEARKEGSCTLEEFRKVWERINGRWDPDEAIWVYAFKVAAQPARPGRLNGFLGEWLL